MKIEMIFKSTLLVIVAVFMSATVSAQSSSRKALTYKGTDKQIMVGDTVRISRDCLKYETRERIIRWAFNKKHVVRQVVTTYSGTFTGEKLTDDGRIAAGTEVSKKWTVDVDRRWVLENTEIYALVLDADGYVNNMNICHIDGGDSGYDLK